MNKAIANKTEGLILFLLVSFLTVLAFDYFLHEEPIPVRTLSILSEAYHIDKKYKSMMGPQSTKEIYLWGNKSQQQELLWITGYQAVMVGKDGESKMPQEFMCHSNLDFDYKIHGKFFENTKNVSNRLFTLSQGQVNVQFPKGFGIPVMSNEPLYLTTQVLNLNYDEADFNVRHKIKVYFVRDKELKKPFQPLYPGAAYGLASLDEQQEYFGVENPDPALHGPGCLIGKNASDGDYTDSFGRRFTGHWVVKPGREVNRTLVTSLMNLPYDTTLHYVAVHLHPFAESLELRDLTDNKTIFKSRVRNYPDKIGLENVEYFSSVKGVPVYKGHDYEIISIYNNTTNENQDSMAVMYLYLLDKAFQAAYGPEFSVVLTANM